MSELIILIFKFKYSQFGGKVELNEKKQSFLPFHQFLKNKDFWLPGGSQKSAQSYIQNVPYRTGLSPTKIPSILFIQKVRNSPVTAVSAVTVKLQLKIFNFKKDNSFFEQKTMGNITSNLHIIPMPPHPSPSNQCNSY